MRTADFDFNLPTELIAQRPAPQRDQSRLFVLHRASHTIEHRKFPHLLDYLHRGDVLVLNNSRVIPARLRGINVLTGGQFEILLLEENAVNDWWAMLRPAKRARDGTEIAILQKSGASSDVRTTVIEKNAEGHRRLRFNASTNIADLLESLGEVPLPPYIARPEGRQLEEDRERYQTTFAKLPGSIAAPTAGLHFTKALLDKLRLKGVQLCFVTLHVGLGTFAPVKSETLASHPMHEERFELSQDTARLINNAKRTGRRVIAVGTTTLRVLETLAAISSRPRKGPSTNCLLAAGLGKTRVFIYPPYEFKIVDALLTNFHLPRSTLLMLVSAFAAPNVTRGRELILSAYAEAIHHRYRFFSYGDAMLLL